METYHTIYFNKSDIEVDSDGRLTDYSLIYIIEEDENAEFLARVNKRGEKIEMDIPVEDLKDMEIVGDGCSTISEALGHFEGWLDNHLEWAEILRQTYWEPAEYVCVGISRF